MRFYQRTKKIGAAELMKKLGDEFCRRRVMLAYKVRDTEAKLGFSFATS